VYRLKNSAAPAVLLGVGLLLLVFAFIPLTVYGVKHIGVVTIALLSAACLVISASWGRLCAYLAARKRVGAVLRAVLCALAALFILLNGAMIWAAYGCAPPTGQTCDTIILGCQVRGSVPSLMLARRLEKGAKYLKDNPQSICVVSGGQGAGEDLPESAVMRTWLIERGIKAVIIEDSESKDTRENMVNSAKILDVANKRSRVAVATDDFHQLRARILAKREGLSEVYALPSRGPLGLVPCYWVREYYAVIQCVFNLY